MTEKEKQVRKELERLHPQLLINCQKTCGAVYFKYGQDLLAMCIEIFLSKPAETQYKVFKDGKIEHYITFVMGMQLKSGSSRFWHQYRRHNEKQREYYTDYIYSPKFLSYNTAFEEESNVKNSPVYKCLKHHIDEFNPYEKMLVQRVFINGETYSSISKLYNISYANLSFDSKKLKQKLKDLCKKYF